MWAFLGIKMPWPSAVTGLVLEQLFLHKNHKPHYINLEIPHPTDVGLVNEEAAAAFIRPEESC